MLLLKSAGTTQQQIIKMNYKKNFKVLVIIHLVGVIVLGILYFMDAGSIGFLKGFFAALLLSLVVQILIYLFKPALFNSKAVKHPDQP
jgi:uncharacterized membrane protein